MKQELAELIEAYVAARISGDKRLLTWAAGELNTFMQKIELAVPKEILEKTTKTEEQ
jgi:hypothetical protein